MNQVNIQFDVFTLRKPLVEGIIRSCVDAALSAEGVPVSCEINVLVTDEKGIRAVNKAGRKVDAPTDVLSFPMFALTPGALPENWEEYLDPDTGMCPLGDMCLCLSRAVVQAKEYGHSLRREVGYLTIHSMLHLLGYDHLDEGPEKARMRAREEAIAATLRGMGRT